MPRLDSPQEMELIYQTSKQVYAGMYSAHLAAKMLFTKTSASEASLKMYFTIYSCMRKGSCYKMGTSAPFTKFLIERIYSDEGGDSILIALSAAKQNADYRKQCNNAQPSIEKVCREIIEEYQLNVEYENLDRYVAKGTEDNNNNPVEDESNISFQKTGNGNLRMRIVIGAIEFEVEGEPEMVIARHKTFVEELLPNALASLSKAYNPKQSNSSLGSAAKKTTQKTPAKKNNTKKKTTVSESVGTKILKKYPVAEKLSECMDFKAKMIPLMFLASEGKIQSYFTVNEIKKMMKETLGLQAETKQIKDVLLRRQDWFKVEDGKFPKYCLIDIGRDYAKNILADYE